MGQDITHDPAYEAVDADDFASMIEVPRYARRSNAFDAIISATHDHFWDPSDARYLDFASPFDLVHDTVLPREQVIELQSAVADRLDEGQQIALANEIARWNLSAVLHGEQGALSLSASLCDILLDPGAQEYAANQTREEARHVAAFSRYIQVRWETPYLVGAAFGALLADLVSTPEVYKKLVGMQMLIEGLAMGTFASLHASARDPLLRRLVQFVMTDEAFHHKFGRIWAARTVPRLSQEEHERVEDWAAACFETLLFNLNNIRQKQMIYARFGLDWEWVRAACREIFSETDRRRSLTLPTNVFRVLVKTLLMAGIVTERTRQTYAAWIDIDGLEAEGEAMIGDAIAADGIEALRAINSGRRRFGPALA